MFDLENEAQWMELLKENHIVLTEFYEHGNPQAEKLTKILKPKFLEELPSYTDTIFVRIDIKKYPNLAKQQKRNQNLKEKTKKIF